LPREVPRLVHAGRLALADAVEDDVAADDEPAAVAALDEARLVGREDIGGDERLAEAAGVPLGRGRDSAGGEPLDPVPRDLGGRQQLATG
jgi:hypothetical protein